MAPRPRVADSEPVPESDRIGELPHPRERFELFGHARAAQTLATAARSGRLHHAWIIAGPKGVGKATLAWRFARALLAHGAQKCPDDLAVAPDHHVVRQIGALAHPDLVVIRRPWDGEKKRFKLELPVDEVRRLHGFFSRHSSEGGARIAIIDAADDMSRSAQNALLKILEEPPANALLLLISHAPGGLLPTTRSRCRLLTLRGLDSGALEDAVSELAPAVDQKSRALLAALAGGAPGRALELAETDALTMYRDIAELLLALPRLNGAKLFGSRAGSVRFVAGPNRGEGRARRPCAVDRGSGRGGASATPARGAAARTLVGPVRSAQGGCASGGRSQSRQETTGPQHVFWY
jgi:DNA polymerase III subunit delta'